MFWNICRKTQSTHSTALRTATLFPFPHIPRAIFLSAHSPVCLLKELYTLSTRSMLICHTCTCKSPLCTQYKDVVLWNERSAEVHGCITLLWAPHSTQLQAHLQSSSQITVWVNILFWSEYQGVAWEDLKSQICFLSTFRSNWLPLAVLGKGVLGGHLQRAGTAAG